MLVAIQESVVVSSAVVNEKNSLEIYLTQGKKLDLFEAMNSGASMDADTHKILLFPVDGKWYGKEATHQEMVMKFRQLTAKLSEAVKQQCTIKWNMFEGTGITSAADIAAKITDEAVCEKIGLNIFKQYAAMVASSDKTKASRMKLVRQSKESHYPTFPDYLLFKKDSNEEYTVNFTESMEIPVAQSKLKYTNSETSKGLHLAGKVEADVAPSGSDDIPFSL